MLDRRSSGRARNEVTYFYVGDLFCIYLGSVYANFQEKILPETSGTKFQTFHCSKVTTTELHMYLIKQEFSPSLHPLPPMQSKRLVLRNGVFLFCTYLTCNKCTYLAFSMIFCLYFKTVLISGQGLTFCQKCAPSEECAVFNCSYLLGQF